MTAPNNPGGASTGADLAATAVATAAALASVEATSLKTAGDRFSAVMGADGIKGDGKRMAAALDLATQSPAMAADAVVSFVVANVPVATETNPPASGQATSYEQKRLAAAGLAQPGASASATPKAAIDRNAIFAARRAAVKEA